MIGLEYIARTFGIENKEIANRLGISPSTVQDWVKQRRKIPTDRLTQLSQLFGLDGSLFQRELTNSEKLEIQIHFFRREDSNDGIAFHLEEEKRKAELFEQIETTVEEPEFGLDNLALLSNVVSVLDRRSANPKECAVLSSVLSFLKNRNDEFGTLENPRYDKYRTLFDVLEELLQ